MLRQAAEKTGDIVGDGTSTATDLDALAVAIRNMMTRCCRGAPDRRR